MFDSGFLTIAKWRGVPIRLHWTLPLGALFFSRFAIVPGFWLGFVVLILAHEIGHTAFALAFRAHVFSVDVHGFGGLTRWSGAVTSVQRALIAWGGIVAQALLFGAAHALSFALGGPTNMFQAELYSALTYTNLYVAALNLIPIAPFDGAEAWRLFPLLLKRRPS